jgi:hypothetical protein
MSIKETVKSLREKAKRTLDWREEDKLVFIWNNQPVVVYYNRSYNHYKILTQHSQEELGQIHSWLSGVLMEELQREEGEDK